MLSRNMALLLENETCSKLGCHLFDFEKDYPSWRFTTHLRYEGILWGIRHGILWEYFINLDGILKTF
jgi:hypothetical protein